MIKKGRPMISFGLQLFKINTFQLISIVLLPFLFTTCKEEVEIGEGGCIGAYFIDNKSSLDLMVQSWMPDNKGDTILLPINERTKFAHIAGFLSRGEPWVELHSFQIFKSDYGVVKLCYEQKPIIDSIWKTKEIDVGNEPYCLVHYTFEITDTMLK